MSVSLFPNGKVNAEALIEVAKEQKLTDLVIIGTDAEGQVWLASSYEENASTAWLMELARSALVDASRL